MHMGEHALLINSHPADCKLKSDQLNGSQIVLDVKKYSTIPECNIQVLKSKLLIKYCISLKAVIELLRFNDAKKGLVP